MPFRRSLGATGSAFLTFIIAGCVHLESGDTSSAHSTETVSGTLTYRQRSALPPGSVIHVGLVEVRGKASDSVVLFEQSFVASGQVPIVFALAYDPKVIDPAKHYAVRARITDSGGRVFWATPRPAPVITQGYPTEVEVLLAPAGSNETAPPATYFFECEGLEFTARYDQKGIYLFLPGRTLLLPEIASGSGAKYTDGKTTFWNKGEEALLEVDGKTYPQCRNNRRRAVWEDAKLNGVDFRAVGNEPGWYLEIYDKGAPEKIDFVGDYGQVYYTFPNVQRETQEKRERKRYVARIGAHQLEVTLEKGPCLDDMSGEAFETSVTVKLNNRSYRGCGKRLH
ncbi:MAG: YbaY family lipoprotein [Hyphomicrobiales bacterium]